MVTTMEELRQMLPKLSPPLLPEIPQQAAERLQRLEEMLKSIRKKLFIKTQGGTAVTKQCAEVVAKLREVVDGLAGKPREEAAAQLEEALKSAEEKIEPLVEKTMSMVVRMT
jgi:chromosome segregation ATPase